jgi:hypothetical protein
VGGSLAASGNLNVTGTSNLSKVYNSGLLRNNGNLQIDQSSGIHKLSFLSSGVYEHEIYANSPTSMMHTIDGTPYMELGNNGLVLPYSGITTNGLSTFNSGVKYPLTTTSSGITLTTANYMVIFTGTAATLNFPASTIANKGQIYKIINHGSGSLSLIPSVATGSIPQTIMPVNTILEVISDGINWRKIN